MNLLELVTFISFRGASRTSMPCISGGSGGGKKKQCQLSHQNSTTPDEHYQYHFHTALSSAVDCPWAALPGEWVAKKLQFYPHQHFEGYGVQEEQEGHTSPSSTGIIWRGTVHADLTH